MANQKLFNFVEWPKDEFPSEYLTATVNGTYEVRDVADATDGLALFASRDSGGLSRLTNYVETPWTESTATPREQQVRIRRAAGTDAMRFMLSGLNDAWFEIDNVKVRAGRLAGGTEADHNLDVTQWTNVKAITYQDSGAVVEVYAWQGDKDAIPSTPIVTRVGSSFGFYERPTMEVQPNHVNQWQIDWIGIGRNGEPAPTGPVEVSAEPFLLRHNPRTNKVIPVLSAPTVTDIGANCVRPRVTKGY